ncbi:hypothetical protein K432DRAFT_1140 [Lepidopterella palustris CBS 459.81]|uniref:Endo-1,3(4)-beta-glucanase n=1 Tax=Lepidopterella palustris CBS 459.81 TaxID=1314670 RepID=A0A8E2JL42_9PEZI|nr:hypothetical protein K432DRAFT_1140 [Lepidopterella palustris CBS 459.81]
MVLQDATASPPESFAEEPYPSDNDHYTSDPSPSPQNGIVIDMDSLPRPVPLIGPLIGFPQRRINESVQQYLSTVQRLIQRELTQEEGSVLAYYIAKSEATRSYGAALGISAGMYRCYSTAATYRFPFWTPNPEKFDPNKFFNVLKGPRARMMWHGLRSAPFLLLGQLFGSALAMNYAAPVAVLSIQRDARLANFNEAMRKQANDAREKAQMEARGQSPGQALPNRNPSPAIQIPRRTEDRSGSEWPSGSSSSDDDMSPTAGNDPWMSSTDADTERVEPFRRPNRAVEKPFTYDDASPTGGMFSNETREKSNEGSAWDRIRKSASSGQPASGQHTSSSGGARPSQTEQRESSTLGDSFSFSSTDEERQLAKAEAQREFDARLERERRGGEFDDQGGRKW